MASAECDGSQFHILLLLLLIFFLVKMSNPSQFSSHVYVMSLIFGGLFLAFSLWPNLSVLTVTCNKDGGHLRIVLGKAFLIIKHVCQFDSVLDVLYIVCQSIWNQLF